MEPAATDATHQLYGATEADEYGKSEYARVINEFGKQIVAEMLPAYLDRAGTLLELACGDGVFARDLRDANPRLRILSTDYSHDFIDVCRRNIGEDDRLTFEPLNALEVRGYRPGELIDFIVFRNSEVYLSKAEKQALLHGVYDRLRPGGYLLYEPVQWAEDILDALPGKNSSVRDMYSHDYTISSMKALYMSEESFLAAHAAAGFRLRDQISRQVVTEVSDYRSFRNELSCGISQRMKLAGYSMWRMLMMARLFGVRYRSERQQNAYLFQKPLD